MTITNTARSVTYIGNGATTVFSFGFQIPDAASLVVQLITIASGLTVTLSNTLYSVTGFGVDAGGTVTYPLTGAMPATQKLVIYRTVPVTQTTDVSNQTRYYADVAMRVWDRIVMMIQDLRDDVNRGITAPIGEVLSLLPAAGSRAGKYMFFNATTGDIEAASVITGISGITATAADLNLLAGKAAGGALAPIASPTFTGVPAAPTATALTSTTQLATTAFATGAIATAVTPLAPKANPIFTGTQTIITATPGDNTTQAASTAFVTAAVAAASPPGYVEIAGSPFTLSAASPFNVTGLSGYKDIMVIGDQTTATVAGLRQLRIGSLSLGVLATAIYAQLAGVAVTEVQLSDSATGARGFSIEILNFNTTQAVKPVRMMGANGTGTWSQMILNASVFDRIQFLNSVAATLGGTLRVFGRV